MLKITIPGIEMYDESKNEFSYTKDTTLQLEHSLVSISKWESRWHKSFIATKNKTQAESLDYIRCMVITQNVPDSVYRGINNEIMKKINTYIDDPMTATTFSKEQEKSLKTSAHEIITSELIYYWMIALQIPMECQKWHLNRLLTLINVCNIKNTPPKKMSKSEIYSKNKALNAARRAKYHSKG
jgi:hypothetical protein